MNPSVIPIEFRFSSPKAQAIFECGSRNIGVNGGFGSGKSYVICQKLLALLLKYPGYRAAIGRATSSALRKTTMQTFWKICPPILYDPQFGGKRADSPVPYIDFIKTHPDQEFPSRLYWIHLDECDATTLRSLELNAAFIDQAEEVSESTYIELDNRVGRWDRVYIPKEYESFLQKNQFTGKPIAPSYHILAFNPPDEGEFSYLYRRFHPASDEIHLYPSTSYFQISSRENKALPQENLRTLETRDKDWQNRFIEGNFSRGEGALHTVSPLSILEVNEEWVNEKLLKRGNLLRSFDYGATSPSCCTWWASIRGNYFCYREYYQPNKPVSYHRRAISELSDSEEYYLSIADPSIFHKESNKKGGFWSLADEFICEMIDGKGLVPPLPFSPADNNEFANRNRLNELLAIDENNTHPLTGEKGAPHIYFIKKSTQYPYGAYEAYRQISLQKKVLLGEINGKKYYSDERDETIEDHAYDTVRYFVSTHATDKEIKNPGPKPGSFLYAVRQMKALKQREQWTN